MKFVILYIGFCFFVTFCDQSNSYKKYSLEREEELFSLVLENKLSESDTTTLFVDPIPLRIDTTLNAQEWSAFIKNQKALLRNRVKVIKEKKLQKGDADFYSSCPFPGQMVPPELNRKNNEKSEIRLPERCKKYVGTQILKMSLSEIVNPAKGKKSNERRIRVQQYFNNGTIINDYHFKDKGNNWEIVRIIRVSWVFS
jgi:hypothetical protein